jgi:pimeloyl-ACP methyl ester carboxylesterase
MINFLKSTGLALAAVVIAACGASGGTSVVATSTAPGTLEENPPLRVGSLNAAAVGAEIGASAAGAQLIASVGAPKCGVDLYHLKFWTLGGAGESTESSGAMLVPTGGTGCSGPRPIVLYAHATNFSKLMNLADPANQEGQLLAGLFAAQGYIVVAPNYAGYDISTLGYHPFLNAAQQSGEMMNILSAARTALPNTLSAATSDNGKLFITGYSEGGHVAMATMRALQAAGAKVTAAAPMSGPYALEALGDAIVYGNVVAGSTGFLPLFTTSYQKAYGNIYSTPSDIYSTTYATGIETLLPSNTTLGDTTVASLPALGEVYTEGLLPELALFDSTTPVVSIPGETALSAVLTAALAIPSNPANPFTPLFDEGFGSPYLLNNDFRVAYAEDAATNPDGAVSTPPQAGVPLAAAPPTQTLRLALYKNDLRNGAWAPESPTLLCGGDADPTVLFGVNTGTMAAFWSALPAGLVTVLDVNATPSGPFAAIQTGFIASQAALLEYYQSAAGGSLSLAAAEAQVIASYHGNVLPYCALAAYAFFSQF